jgi:hypothetical protein
VHAAIEEQVFYPVARAAVPETEDIALESLEEHHIVKWVLSELVGMDPAQERFDAKVTVLMENVRHHVKEEEHDFFPKVRAQLGRNELADLGQALADAKTTAPTQPHPRMSDVPPANAVAGTIAGVVDKVGSNLSGIAQGSVTAVQDLIARITGGDRPKVSPTGTTTARTRAGNVRDAATTAADGVQQTAQRAKTAATTTAKTARSGAATTAKTARTGAATTAKTARSGAATTAKTARSGAKATAGTAKRSASKTAAAASGSR